MKKQSQKIAKKYAAVVDLVQGVSTNFQIISSVAMISSSGVRIVPANRV